MRAPSIAATTILAVLYFGPGDASGFPQCSLEELTSRNPERCAATSAAAMLHCTAHGSPLGACDLSKSARFCDVLSAACNPIPTVKQVLATIYGTGTPQDSPCLRGLALAGTRLLRGTLRHARIGKLTDLPDDMMRCADRGARKCPTAPTLQAPCDSGASGTGAASCLCNLSACSSLSSTDLQARAEAEGWLSTLNHALSLGYEIGTASECADGGITVPLSGSSVTGGGITYDAARHVAFITIVLPDGSSSVFNQGGGLHIAPDGSTRPVGPDGVSPLSQAPLIPGASCIDFWSLLACRASQSGQCAAAIAACHAIIEVPPLYAACMAQALLKCVIVFRTPPTCPPDPQGLPCETGTVCSIDGHCFYGFCRGSNNDGVDCSSQAMAPRCTGALPALEIILSATCRGGSCKPNETACPPCQVCKGTSGSASCAPSVCGDGAVEGCEQCDPAASDANAPCINVLQQACLSDCSCGCSDDSGCASCTNCQSGRCVNLTCGPCEQCQPGGHTCDPVACGPCASCDLADGNCHPVVGTSGIKWARAVEQTSQRCGCDPTNPTDCGCQASGDAQVNFYDCQDQLIGGCTAPTYIGSASHIQCASIPPECKAETQLSKSWDDLVNCRVPPAGQVLCTGVTSCGRTPIDLGGLPPDGAILDLRTNEEKGAGCCPTPP